MKWPVLLAVFSFAAGFCPRLSAEEAPRMISVHEWKAAGPNEDGWLKSSWRNATARQILDWSKRPAAPVQRLRHVLREDKRGPAHAGLLLYLARYHTREGNFEQALSYQKRLLLDAPVGPWTMETISEYRGILLLYNWKTGAALEEAIPESGEKLRKIEREFARSSDLGAYHKRLAEYYFSTLNFDDAKRHIELAFASGKRKKTFFREELPRKAPLRRLLRNIYMLEGNFSGALKESRRLLEEEGNVPVENDYVIDSFLREASGSALSPLDIRYLYQEGKGFLPVPVENAKKIFTVRA